MQDIYTGVLENNDRGTIMVSVYYEKFVTMIDKQKPILSQKLSSTIAHLVHTAQLHGETALPSYLSSLLQQHMFTPYTFDSAKHLVCGRYSAEKTQTLLLFSHCPPQQDAFARWAMFVTRLLTFGFYHETIGSLPVNVVWLIDTTTESQKERTKSHFIADDDAILQGSGCLYDVPASATLPFHFLALGTKGLLSVEAEVQTASLAHDALYSTILPNAAWRLLWALQSIKNPYEEILIEGFYDTLVPMEDEEIALLRAMPDDEQTLKQQLHVDDFLLHLHGFQLRYTHFLLPTCTITQFCSGTDEDTHTLPFSARALLDIHLVPNQEPADIYRKLRHHLDAQGFADVHTTMRESKSPQHASLHEPFTQLVVNATDTIYGDNMPILPLLPLVNILHPLQAQLSMPILYTRMDCLSDSHDEHDILQEKHKQSLVDGMKCLGMIMEDMA